MRWRLAILVILQVLPACGGPERIERLYVPREEILRSFRLMAEGDGLSLEGKTHFALLKYLEAARLNPYHEVIFNKLAITYARLGQFRQASRAVDRSIRLEPDYAFGHNTQGIIHMANQFYSSALKSFKRAVRLQPEEANFRVNLGHAYMKLNKYEEGLEAFRSALELDPEILSREDVIELTYESAEVPDPEEFYQMARAFAGLGNRDLCLDYLEEAFSAGFDDGERLFKDSAFAEFLEDGEFLRLIELYGIKPRPF